METKFTKGKWVKHIKSGGSTKRTWIQVLLPNRGAIDVDYLTSDDCSNSKCCATESHANALLISKAPEMFEMLKLVIDEMKNEGYPDLLNSVKQLLKEATEL